MSHVVMRLEVGKLVQTDSVPEPSLEEGGQSVAHLKVLIQGVTGLYVDEINLRDNLKENIINTTKCVEICKLTEES